MNPRLIAIAGASRGATYTLGKGEVKIGRDPANQICIGDPSLSRRHCLIIREGERFKINDLESRNGTFVIGVPVKERLLDPGDQIQIGDCLLLFLLEADVAPAAGVARLDEGTFATRSRVRLRVEDALYLEPEMMLAMPLSAGRMARDLSALVRITTMINSITDSSYDNRRT